MVQVVPESMVNNRTKPSKEQNREKKSCCFFLYMRGLEGWRVGELESWRVGELGLGLGLYSRP